jgi:hypothetical protein
VTVLVLHDVGDEAGGAAWRSAFEAAAPPGPVLVPDLPGHGAAPAPPGGCYEVADAALVGAAVVADLDGDPPVVVGIGVNGWPAQLLGLAGRATALVLVDGLAGPWTDPRTAIAAGRDWLRAIADDPTALAPPPAVGPDPRLRHGVLPHGDRLLAERTAAALTVPVVLVETPASPLTAAEVDDLVPHFGAGASVVRLDDRDPEAIARLATGLA